MELILLCRPRSSKRTLASQSNLLHCVCECVCVCGCLCAGYSVYSFNSLSFSPTLSLWSMTKSFTVSVSLRIQVPRVMLIKTRKSAAVKMPSEDSLLCLFATIFNSSVIAVIKLALTIPYVLNKPLISLGTLLFATKAATQMHYAFDSFQFGVCLMCSDGSFWPTTSYQRRFEASASHQ